MVWNKGKNGLQVAWNKGLTKDTDERVRKYSLKMSQSALGKTLSFSHRNKIRKSLIGRKPWNIGVPTPLSVKNKIKEKLTGSSNPFYGKIHTPFSKTKISISRKGKCMVEKNPNYVGHLLEPFKDSIISSYLSGESAGQLSIKYGVSDVTILNYLSKWKISRRNSYYSFKGFYTCLDGHKVRSLVEKEIDDFLYSSSILHDTNQKISQTFPYFYDFYLPSYDLYIEYWGFSRSPDYRKKMLKKWNLYQKLNLSLLSLFPNENVIQKIRQRIEF